MEQGVDLAQPQCREQAILSRREIEGLIAQGRTIIIVDGKVMKVDAWLKYHPGGDKAIMHMVGRDATDEVNAYVGQSSTDLSADRRMTRDQTTFRRSTSAHEQLSDWEDYRSMEEFPTANTGRPVQALRQGLRWRGGKGRGL